VTGLVWQRDPLKPDGGLMRLNLTDAAAHCAGLTLGGFSDWRLPSLIELESIVNDATYAPPIEPTAFPNTPADWFLTSSSYLYLGQLPQAWGVMFTYGATGERDVASGAQVRCVRGALGLQGLLPGAPEGRYTLTADTVVDTVTHLTWQRVMAPTLLTEPQGVSYCQTLDAGSMTGWRLPTIKELQTLVDVRQIKPAIDTNAFPDTPPTGTFWSSTPYASDLRMGWYLNFVVGGESSYIGLPGPMNVRCVQ
jgi:hypothetical protein